MSRIGAGQEGEINAIFQPGDPVIWWKRIPGGDYVVPMTATVLAITAKRVKILADDDGQVVTRYVPIQSLQRRDTPASSPA